MEYLQKENLVLGCGNPLFGDDGFGPELVSRLKDSGIENKFGNIGLIDCGSGISPFLNLINSSKHNIKNLFIVDCGDFNGELGDILILDGKDISNQNFIKSSHSMSIAHEIKKFSSNIKLILVKGNVDPDTMKLEMNEAVRNSINKVEKIILKLVEGVQ